MILELPHDFDPFDATPDWFGGGRVHNWKNHVGPAVRAAWIDLSIEARSAVASDAQREADAEEWD